MQQIVNLLRRGGRVLDFKTECVSLSISLGIKQYLRARTPFAKDQQGGVDGDPRQPAIEIRSAFKSMESQIDPEERLLQCVLGIFRVLGDSIDRSVEPSRISRVEFRECSRRAGLSRRNDLLISCNLSFLGVNAQWSGTIRAIHE